MYIKEGYKFSFLGVNFRWPYSLSPPPQIVVPSFPGGSKNTSIDVLNDLSTLLRGKGLKLVEIALFSLVEAL